MSNDKNELPAGMMSDTSSQAQARTSTQMPTPTAQADSAQQQSVSVDQTKLDMLIQQIRDNQNISLALLGGLGAAVVGAILWAAVTAFTGWQIGFMAIGVGFLVGLAVRHLGRGIDRSFGVVGASLSLVGCLFGNVLASCIFIAEANGVPFFDVLAALNLGLIGEIMTATFHPLDVFFYGLALYYGYRYSFRQLSKEELTRIARH